MIPFHACCVCKHVECAHLLIFMRVIHEIQLPMYPIFPGYHSLCFLCVYKSAWQIVLHWVFFLLSRHGDFRFALRCSFALGKLHGWIPLPSISSPTDLIYLTLPCAQSCCWSGAAFVVTSCTEKQTIPHRKKIRPMLEIFLPSKKERGWGGKTCLWSARCSVARRSATCWLFVLC